MITSYSLAADPVCYLNSPYVTFLSQLLKKVDVKLVLILHGVEDWESPNDLMLTSWNKCSLIDKTEYLNLLISMLKVKGIKDIGYDSPETIELGLKTLNHLIFEDLSIPAIRMGIHKRYRLPKLHPTNYLNLHTALAQFLMLVGVK